MIQAATVLDDLSSWEEKVSKDDSALSKEARKKSSEIFSANVPPPRSHAAAGETKRAASLSLHPDAPKSEADRVQAAVREKDKGNECMRSKDFEEAVVYYTRSIK